MCRAVEVDMGCTDKVWFDEPTIAACPRSALGKTGEQQDKPLAIPLYHSTSPNCSGQTVGSCDKDIVEQPVEFASLSARYTAFAREFIANASHDASPFFLYVPFSHIHVPQYYAPEFTNKSGRGPFYDTLLELDDTVGAIMQALKDYNIDNNTLVSIHFSLVCKLIILFVLLPNVTMSCHMLRHFFFPFNGFLFDGTTPWPRFLSRATMVHLSWCVQHTSTRSNTMLITCLCLYPPP